MTTPRIPPKPLSEFDDELREAFGEFVSDDKLYNVFATLAHHPDLVRGWVPFVRHVLATSTLTPRDREIVILRIGWLCQSEYEWVQHVLVGMLEGITEEEIEQIRTGPDAKGVSEQDSLLIRATDELHNDAKISDDTWQKLSQIYSTQQLMDIVFAVGNYNMISMALKTFGVPLDEDVEPFAYLFKPQ